MLSKLIQYKESNPLPIIPEIENALDTSQSFEITRRILVQGTERSIDINNYLTLLINLHNYNSYSSVKHCFSFFYVLLFLLLEQPENSVDRGLLKEFHETMYSDVSFLLSLYIDNTYYEQVVNIIAYNRVLKRMQETNLSEMERKKLIKSVWSDQEETTSMILTQYYLLNNLVDEILAR